MERAWLREQRDRLPQLAAERDWDYAVIEDLGISGRTTEARPGMTRLLELIEADALDVVLVIEQSRLTRDTTLEDLGRIIGACQEHDVAIATPDRLFHPNDLDDFGCSGSRVCSEPPRYGASLNVPRKGSTVPQARVATRAGSFPTATALPGTGSSRSTRQKLRSCAICDTTGLTLADIDGRTTALRSELAKVEHAAAKLDLWREPRVVDDSVRRDDLVCELNRLTERVLNPSDAQRSATIRRLVESVTIHIERDADGRPIYHYERATRTDGSFWYPHRVSHTSAKGLPHQRQDHLQVRA